MSDILTLAETAALCGITPKRLRQVWPRWARELAFPAPFLSPPVARWAWRKAPVLAWREGREGALGAGELPSLRGRPAAVQPLAAQRAEARRLMQAA